MDGPNTHKCANNATKREKKMVIQIFKYIINNTCLLSICYNLSRASQKLCRASQNHKQLARRGKLVLEIMLVPGLAVPMGPVTFKLVSRPVHTFVHKKSKMYFLVLNVHH